MGHELFFLTQKKESPAPHYFSTVRLHDFCLALVANECPFLVLPHNLMAL